jgi:hypothetical protein
MPPGGRSFDFGKPVQAMSRLVTGRSDYSPSWRKPRRQWSPPKEAEQPDVPICTHPSRGDSRMPTNGCVKTALCHRSHFHRYVENPVEKTAQCNRNVKD